MTNNKHTHHDTEGTQPRDSGTLDSGGSVDTGAGALPGDDAVAGGLCSVAPAEPLGSKPGDLGLLPEPGVHPRVLFGPEHIQVLRDRWAEDGYPATVASKGLSWAGAYSDASALAALDPTAELTEADLDAWWIQSESRGIGIYIVALHAEVYDDAALRETAVRAVLNQARLNLASRSLKPDHVVWSSSAWDHGTPWATGGVGWALAYDLLHDHFDAQQKATIVEAISAVTSGRRAWGMGEPGTRKLSNWAPYISGDLLTMALTIEGEDGYDEEVVALAAENIQQWLDHALYPGGGALEDGYSLLALREGSVAMLALDRRGSETLSHPHYQAYLRHVAHSLEPSLDGDYVGHSSGGGLGYPAFWAVAKAAWPDEPVVDYLWRYYNGEDNTRMFRHQSLIAMLTFGLQGDGTDTWNATGEPLSWCDPRRGLVITRSDDTQDALYLHLDARPDAVFLGHDNPDRGAFTLSALGRSWVPDQAWRDFAASTDHSLVHVDGQGQILKAPAVDLLEARDDGDVVVALADLAYAYSWKWSAAWPAENAAYSAPWEEEHTDPRALGWPDGSWDAWLPRSLYGHGDVGFSGLWTGRAPHLPMEHALRGVVMAREAQPWVLVSDDVAMEDGAQHSWDWQLHLEGDLAVLSSEGSDLVLGANGEPERLLVRVLQTAESDAFAWSHETYTAGGEDAGRLHITVEAAAARFRILLVPHREGDALPNTQVSGEAITIGERTVTVTHETIHVESRH